jgi:putative ABC transport system permease protein
MIGDTWYAVIGILADSGLAGGALDTSAIIGDLWVQYHFADTFPEAGEISDIFVRAESGQLDQVANLLAEAASPGFPHQVQVGRMVDVAAARAAVDNALNTLGLALGGIALLVGGVGIMNTMVVTVMERRGEIGLRRALGARPGQVATQFTTEAVALSALGGTLGLALGAAAAIVIATVSNQPVVIPATTAFLGLGLSVVVGALAGMQPAIRAARVAPVTALRAV